ncbi:hypothetical protein [Brucella intermedia]|uniref:hypothetical protein n=1 Tax=Brucella intermedia TaxID=94625 RepID=UPI0021C5A96F|nr:hypothetical protein [Brucella intermedia]UXO83037.1 hypothetical protein N8I72_12055 [Brucella intermedia]WGJ06679.1 hypothetical protein QBQ48_12590 [Brucella intermedia]
MSGKSAGILSEVHKNKQMAHAEKCETVSGQDARQNKQIARLLPRGNQNRNRFVNQSLGLTDY